jgi:hypothetical protein
MANWKVIALINGDIEAVSGPAAQDRPGAHEWMVWQETAPWRRANHDFGFNQGARLPVELRNVPLPSTFTEIYHHGLCPKSARHYAIVDEASDKPSSTHDLRRTGQAPPNPKAKEEAESRQQQVLCDSSFVSSAGTQIEVSDGGEIHSHKGEESAEV